MNKAILQSVIFISLFVCCQKEKGHKANSVIPEIAVPKQPQPEECYMGTYKKDTVSLSFIRVGNQVTDGKLTYKLFEKDKNNGKIAGVIKGDTLFAKYTFMSEGKVSIRQVAFLKKGDNYIEGFGEVYEYNGITLFKKTKKLKFIGTTQLSKIDCNK